MGGLAGLGGFPCRSYVFLHTHAFVTNVVILHTGWGASQSCQPSQPIPSREELLEDTTGVSAWRAATTLPATARRLRVTYAEANRHTAGKRPEMKTPGPAINLAVAARYLSARWCRRNAYCSAGRSHPMPEPNDTNTAISAGVAQAIQRIFGSNDADARFFDAVRQGTRDAVWLIAANANATDTPPAGHAD